LKEPKSNEFHGSFEAAVRDSGVNLGGSNLSVTKRSLHQMQVSGLLIEPGSEGMSEGMYRSIVIDASLFHPMRDAVLNLPGGEPSAVRGLKEGRVTNEISGFGISGQKLQEIGLEINSFFSAAFDMDFGSSITGIDIASVERHQRAEPHASTIEKRDNHEVALGGNALRIFDRIEEPGHLIFIEDSRRFPLGRSGFDKAGGINFDISRFGEEAEEDPDGGFQAIGRDGASPVILSREKPRQSCRVDLLNLCLPSKPVFEKLQLSQIGSFGVGALAISLKLSTKSCYCLIHFHDIPPFSCYIHELIERVVKFIMRTLGIINEGFYSRNCLRKPHEMPVFARCRAFAPRMGQ
jgi:hypothetical protein